MSLTAFILAAIFGALGWFAAGYLVGYFTAQAKFDAILRAADEEAAAREDECGLPWIAERPFDPTTRV